MQAFLELLFSADGATALLAAILGALLSPLTTAAWTYWRRPRLQLKFSEERGCVYRTKKIYPGVNGSFEKNVLYVRMAVSHRAGRPASNCRAYVFDVRRLENGIEHDTEFRDTLPLSWSYRDGSESVGGIDIPCETTHFFDVIESEERLKKLVIASPVLPVRYEDFLRFAGIYVFHVVVTADDATPQYGCVTVSFDRSWDSVRIVDARPRG